MADQREPPDSSRADSSAEHAGDVSSLSSVLAGGGSPDASTAARGAMSGASGGGYQTLGHEALFETAETAKEAASRCHACDGELRAEDDEGFSVPGRGLLVFTRGDERRAEEPKLCPTCGAAIGMTMLTRWAIEEDEG